ncbi:MAG: ABC transporter permease, partial [Desulfobacterales bacterium]|nr:ABC transporter permease [Desulfobacterales bacterium]
MVLELSRLIRKYGIVLILIAIMLVFAVVSPVFLTLNNIMNIIRQVSMLGIVAAGMTCVIIAGGIDLSVGSQISVIGVVVALLTTDFGLSPVAAALIGLALTTGIGFFNGVVITKTGIAPLIATLAMLTVLQGVAYLACGGLPIYGLPPAFSKVAQSYLWFIPVPVVIMTVIVLATGFFLRRTYAGRYVYAVGSNEEATRLSGINVDSIRILVYTLCGFLTGIAGIILLGRVNSGQPITGRGYELDVLSAIVLGGVSINGGKGGMFAAIVGVLIIGVLNNGLIIAGVNEYYQLVIKGLVLLAAVVADSLQLRRRAR